MAELTGIPPATYWRLERGKTKEPRLSLLVNCALVLDVTVEEIVEDEWLSWTLWDVEAPAPEGRERARLGRLA